MVFTPLEVNDLKELFRNQKEKGLEDFFTFLRFASIATDPAYHQQVLACKDWLFNYLKLIGLKVEVWETKNAPILFAEDNRAGEGKPTLLLYNHYDVQPVDPLDLWDSPPFEPKICGKEVFARGAVDNKGQCFYTLLAIKTLTEKYGHLPVNLKWLIEGEEESGSPGLSELLNEKKERLKADHLLVVDSGLHEKETPSIALGARGIVTFTVTLRGSKFDLHSGGHGGIAYNPNRALVELLASLHNDKGGVNIPGFYDEVVEPTQQEKKELDFSFDEKKYQEMFGVIPSGMENGVPPLEAVGTRPTIEFNGICGGYFGTGFKTVIPAIATAKISCRLVPYQNPQKIMALVQQTLYDRVAKGVEISIEAHPGQGAGFWTKPSSKIAKIASQAYTDIFQKPCSNILMGGSVPIAADLAKTSGAEIVLIGLSLPDDHIHAPNEHFGIDRLEQGFMSIVRIIEILNSEEKNHV